MTTFEPGSVNQMASDHSFIFLVPKLRSVAQNEWKKTPIYIFSTFVSKINKFEQKNRETKNFSHNLIRQPVR